ncbi:4-hydroxyphenylacetate 3-hydroxylase N-terminal domain-containing protein [Geoglobus acetivorans]|uniref:4-hydroxyphenylacetate 3-monooxygenase n=1 Tax=Geoglobus acetivorans TaxID=565033 RepID=A0A0A7GFA9_GEOAI|nr:4-hydroxyphenylacetate 3-monooxygenase [Geoglobus acetivorans]
MINGDEYVRRIKGYSRDIYVRGERAGFDHPNVEPVLKAISVTYDLAKEKGYHTHSELVNREVNILNTYCRTPDDLIKRYDFQRELSMRLATCNYRCPGADAINAFASVLEGEERNRFLVLLREIQENDYACTSALTDPKGNRSRRPSEQREMYVRVVEERDDGIIVEGAKIHQSGAFAADVNFFLPGQTFREGEEEFAVAFALKPEDRGVKYILQNTGMQAKQRDGGEFEYGNPYGDRITCTVVLDRVFVPWERVFIYKDLKKVRELLTAFANSHRCAGAACKAGFVDSMTGAASLMIRANGLENVQALRSKLGEMSAASEGAYAVAVGAAVKGAEKNGVWLPDAIMANAGKVIGVEGFTKVMRHLADIAGGIPGTAPSEFDLRSEEIGRYVEKYVRGAEDFSAEDRLRLIKFIEFWLTSSHYIGALHGGGSVSASVIFLQYMSDFSSKEDAVRKAINLKS